MTAFRTAASRWLRHPSALLVGIIVTFFVGLLTLVPAADEYSAIRERSNEVDFLLQQGERDQRDLGRMEQIRQILEEDLAGEQNRAVDEEHSHRLRQTLVEYSREAECHLRKVDMGPVRIRQWHAGDHPLQTRTTSSRGKKTDFLLEVRDLRMTLSGELTHITTFLEKFAALDLQMNVQQLNLRAMDPEGGKLQLELVLQLYGVRRTAQGDELKS